MGPCDYDVFSVQYFSVNKHDTEIYKQLFVNLGMLPEEQKKKLQKKKQWDSFYAVQPGYQRYDLLKNYAYC